MGNVLQSLLWLRNPHAYLEREIAQGNITFQRTLPVTGRVLFTGDPAITAEIIGHPDLVGGRGIRALRRILGSSSLIMLDGPAHVERRRLLGRFFADASVTGYDSHVDTLTVSHLNSMQPGSVFSAFTFASSVLLHVIIRIIFGMRSYVEEWRMVRLVESFLTSTRNPLPLFFKPLQVNLGRWSGWGRALQAKRLLIEEIRHSLRAELGPDSLIHQIKDVHGSGSDKDLMGEDLLIEEILSLLLFGHETTAASVSWSFAYTLYCSGVSERIRQEVAEVRSKALRLTPENLLYTQACVNESMRMNPVVMHLMRVATRPVTIGNYTIQSGEMAAPSPVLAHRNPSLFEEPGRFLPERFLASGIARYSFYPFGLGDRACLGQHLALRQMTIMIAAALEERRLRPAAKRFPDPVRNMVLMIPRHGMLMRL